MSCRVLAYFLSFAARSTQQDDEGRLLASHEVCLELGEPFLLVSAGHGVGYPPLVSRAG